MAGWLVAYAWGAAIGLALFLGACLAWFAELSHRQIATVMAFGAGVLMALLSVGLMEEAWHAGGWGAAIGGFVGGGALFSTVNWLLARRGARHRKRCGGCVRQPSETEVRGSGLAIAVGSVMDALPEAFVAGLSLVGGMGLGKAVLAGFVLANFPQGLSSASGMKEAGRSAAYVFGIWGAVILLSGAAAFLGYSLFAPTTPHLPAAAKALAAGAILAMLAETMIPEAFEKSHSFMGLAASGGFILFFLLAKLWI